MSDDPHRKLLEAAEKLISILGCNGDCLLVPRELAEEDELRDEFTDAFCDLADAVDGCRNQ